MSIMDKTETFRSQLDYFIALYRECFLSASKHGFKESGERGTIAIPFVSIDEAICITQCKKGKASKKIIAWLNKGIFYFTQGIITKQQSFDGNDDILNFTKIYDLEVGFSLLFIIRTTSPEYNYFPCIYAPQKDYHNKIDSSVIERGEKQQTERIEKFKESLPEDFRQYLMNRDVGNFDPNSESSKKAHKEVLNNMENPTKCSNCHKISTKVLSRCSGCKAAGYCDRECQRANWKEHKQICNTLKHMRILMQTVQYY